MLDAPNIIRLCLTVVFTFFFFFNFFREGVRHKFYCFKEMFIITLCLFADWLIWLNIQRELRSGLLPTTRDIPPENNPKASHHNIHDILFALKNDYFNILETIIFSENVKNAKHFSIAF